MSFWFTSSSVANTGRNTHDNNNTTYFQEDNDDEHCDEELDLLEQGQILNTTDGGTTTTTLPFFVDPAAAAASSSTAVNIRRKKWVSFRPLNAADRLRIQELHEQWFPVIYSQEFYDELVMHHRLATSGDPLFTCAACLPNNSNGNAPPQQQPQQQHYCQAAGEASLQQSPHQDDDTILIGCVVGAVIGRSRLSAETADLLLPSPEIHSRLFYIMTLGTVDEYRNLGIATSLVEQCIDVVEADPGCGALYLHVIPFNHAAIRFYEKLGFYRVCTIPDYYNIDGKNYDCFLYAKYFHGNRGHRTLYKLVSGAVYSLWERIKAPLALFYDP